MIKTLASIVWIAFLPMLNAQDRVACDLNERVVVHLGDSIRIREIPQAEYNELGGDPLISRLPVRNGDSLTMALIDDHEFISLSHDTLYIRTRNYPLKLYEVQSEDPRQQLNYRLHSIYTDRFVVIYESGYEAWTYYLIDLHEGMTYFLPSPPKIIADRFVYGSTNYYGDHDFVVYDLQSGRQTSFTLPYTMVRSYYMEGDTLKFSVRFPCGNSNRTAPAYYAVTIH